MLCEKTLEQVEQCVTPILDSLGFKLIERELIPGPGGWVLRLFIDREGASVTIDDCERASRAVEGVLDVENFIPQRYSLEISSPGLDRPLRRPEDFERFAGKPIDLKAKQGVEGRHHFVGVLKGLRDGAVVVEADNREWLIPLGEIKKAKLKYEF